MTLVYTVQKRPLLHRAIRYSGNNGTDALRFMFPDIEPDATAFDETIRTLEGDMHCSPGDYIIQGIRGEFWPIKADIFDASYEIMECEWLK
jgi:hypothetical protein